jgi:hypothetical protein
MRPGTVFIALVCLLGVAAGTDAGFRSWRQQGPRVVLWAWERPEDLSFIDPERTDIAFLAGTVRIQTDRVWLDPRHQPLKMPAGAKPITVVRIESDRRSVTGLNSKMKRDVASAILHLVGSFNASQVQIDFDARVSERDFYREVLQDVRRQLPDAVSLSITALASWCMQDTWMNGLPVQEAVPMLFRMGPEGRDLLRSLEKDGEFREPLCRASVGISLDEPVARLPRGKRVYVFSPTAWTEARERRMLQEVSRWQ